jgi:hypothetical protein
MITRTYQKLCDAGRLQKEIVDSGKPVDPSPGARFYGISVNYASGGAAETNVFLYDDITQNETAEIDGVVVAHIPTPLPPLPPVPQDSEGKMFVRAESRPLDCTTYFTTAGDKVDAPQAIGDGNRLEWDAADPTYNWVTDGSVKRYTVDIQFIDSVWIKEGTVYWSDAMKDGYLDMYIVCPPGGYFMYLGQVKQNTTGQDLIIEHYVNKHPIQGSWVGGDEMNTETCSQAMPTYLKIRMVMTIPVADVTSHGYVELEMFRQRTIIYEG